MFYAFLSSAGRIQWYSAVLSNICNRQDLWFLRLVIKKAMKIWYSILPDYGLLTGFSIVTVHHGVEQTHSVLLNILSSFPCRMYPMNHEVLRPWDWHLYTQNRVSLVLSVNIGSFFMQESTESQLYNNYTIRYPLYYSLRRREPTSDEREKISTFFLKIGFITYKWYVLKEKKLIDCVPFTLHWSDWIPENVAYVKSTSPA